MSLNDRARSLRNNPTEAEKLLWSRIQADQLGVRFRRQHGIQQFIVDFYCPEKGLVIEIDGGQHNESTKDAARTVTLEAQGLKVIRFWNNDVLSNIDGVLQEIQSVLQSLPSKSPLSQARGETLNPWRNDFPALNGMMSGKPVAFLDSGASAQKPQVVIDAIANVMNSGYANIHRGVYEFSQKTTAAFEAARGKVAKFINASENEIVFTRNATEGVNLVAQAWGRTHLKAGDEIVLTQMEHHANIVPWHILRDQIGIVIKYIPVTKGGDLDLPALDTLLTDKTRLVSFVHVSNALGTINDAAAITARVKSYNPGIKVMVDGSQSVVHMQIDVKSIGCDWLVWTGHKLYGPTGVGVLWGKYDVLDSMSAYQGGGDMIETVALEGTTFKSPPHRFEAGTPAIAEVIGLGAAIDYVSNIGWDSIAAHEKSLANHLFSSLSARNDITLVGAHGAHRAGIVSFLMNNAHATDTGMILDQCGVAVRTGHHCCQPLMGVFGITGTVRASLALYNTIDDIDALMAGLDKAKRLLAA